MVETNIITSRILPHLCGLKGFISENQYYLQPHKQSLERKVFCWPCEGLCLDLEEHLLSFDLGEGDTKSGGACCKMQALSCRAAPGSHCGSVHKTRGYFTARQRSCAPLASIRDLLPTDGSGHRQHCSGHLLSGGWWSQGPRCPTASRTSFGSCACQEAKHS